MARPRIYALTDIEEHNGNWISWGAVFAEYPSGRVVWQNRVDRFVTDCPTQGFWARHGEAWQDIAKHGARNWANDENRLLISVVEGLRRAETKYGEVVRCVDDGMEMAYMGRWTQNNVRANWLRYNVHGEYRPRICITSFGKALESLLPDTLDKCHKQWCSEVLPREIATLAQSGPVHTPVVDCARGLVRFFRQLDVQAHMRAQKI